MIVSILWSMLNSSLNKMLFFLLLLMRECATLVQVGSCCGNNLDTAPPTLLKCIHVSFHCTNHLFTWEVRFGKFVFLHQKQTLCVHLLQQHNQARFFPCGTALYSIEAVSEKAWTCWPLEKAAAFICDVFNPTVCFLKKSVFCLSLTETTDPVWYFPFIPFVWPLRHYHSGTSRDEKNDLWNLMLTSQCMAPKVLM